MMVRFASFYRNFIALLDFAVPTIEFHPALKPSRNITSPTRPDIARAEERCFSDCLSS